MPRIVLAIDIEPDGRRIVSDDSWRGTHVALAELAEWRARLEERSQSSVHLNWFFRLDPQIERTWGRRDWILEVCPDLISTAERLGDLSGIHVHGWNQDSQRGLWFEDASSQDWLAHCVGTSVEAYESIFGAPPIASRFGNRSIRNHDVELLKRHGIRYDLTLEPGSPSHPLSADAWASSPLPDHRRAPRVPYRPSPDDYLVPMVYDPSAVPGGDFWMVPVTMTTGLHWLPLRRWPFLVRTTLPMNLVLRPRRVWTHLAAELDRDAAEPVVMVLRTGDLAKPHFLTSFRFIMERLASHARIRSCRFARVDQVVEGFAEAHGAASACVRER